MQRLASSPGAKGERCHDWAGALLPVVEERDGDKPTRRRWMPTHRSITDSEDIAYLLAGAPPSARARTRGRLLAACSTALDG
ncbi:MULTISPECIES: hypothetical protein [unclassified Streptomyces]|uniref:hypothetical protein n=1 Tax=unclassified Streptomyces TaxID=2593676 RepID=UPI00225B7A05|nr:MULTISPECIES: hypothetical protein [unclassified Streptomyces]MCX4791674.1 hypothetical protein [Streptomyces sp. NBC_01221]MCX4792700.1 hypothetical protein [Streptomyces sp. NBC_01242]WSP60628.1 hypothetical protein OG466_00655 [Streptomyces sp. NBC_01240]WSU19699.1 hypothetical protein OG508_00550 [Streptomyces sp. NBC_01108]